MNILQVQPSILLTIPSFMSYWRVVNCNNKVSQIVILIFEYLLIVYWMIFPPCLVCKGYSRKQTERKHIPMMSQCFRIIVRSTILIAGISQLVGMEILDDVCITRPPELKIEIKLLLYGITITATIIIGCLALFVFYRRRHRADYQGMCVWFKSQSFDVTEV